MAKCLQVFDLPATEATVSDLGHGNCGIILQSTTESRKVACAVPADRSVIEDRGEMNRGAPSAALHPMRGPLPGISVQ